MDQTLIPLALFTGITCIALTAIGSLRRYLLAKSRIAIQGRVLDQFTTSNDFLAYAQTESGRQFLDRLIIEPSEAAPSPHRRIINGLYAGIVLTSAGVALLLLHHMYLIAVPQLLVLGVVALGLGIGFCLATIASYWLARSMSLFDRQRQG